MVHQELLRDLTESYLRTLIAEVSGAVRGEFDPHAPFGELGIDSFYVLKIIRRLEADFGTLPKSLLFENFNIHDLAGYFVAKHEPTLVAKFGQSPAPAPAPAPVSSAPASPAAVVAPAPKNANAIRILEKDAFADPELKDLVRGLFDTWKLDACVSRGTRRIAPNLFIGSERRGYFNYGRSGNILLVYGYCGPREHLPVLSEEMYRYCEASGLQFNILSDEELPPVCGVALSATPFGAMQRVTGLQQFTMDGGAMRRLRYQVQKFQKAGRPRTAEYRCGTSAETDREIVAIIEQWCAARTMVNPLVHDVKAEVLAGTLASEHRLFLTYLDEVLQNVIVITELSARENGYLMDLEFYPPGMPLGGLEFGIVEIIEALRAEGRDVLSLGGTYGCKLDASPSADPEIDRILDDLRAQNIFNDEGNLQFKNKFRPDTRPIYLCRPVSSANPDNVIDVIMMIADPERMQTPAMECGDSAAALSMPAPIETARATTLAAHGFNPLNVPHEQIDIDLKTDSWAQLDLPAIDAQMRHLHGQLQQPVHVDDALRAVFPFAHVTPTASGQAAEHLFFKAWPRQGMVLQNLLFPSTIFHQIDNGFTVREVPCAAVFRVDSRELFKANIDLDALEAQLASDAASVAMVCIEVSDNAAGGHPVSLAHLRAVKALLAPHAIPLVLDITRIVDNAQLLIEHEAECAGKSVWTVVREILGCADAVIGSLTKDFCVAKGGIIATSDASLARRIEELVREEGSGLDLIDRRLIALAVQSRKSIETRVARRIDATRRLWRALKDAGVPVVEPAGAHCVVVDVKRIPEFASFAQPAASFGAWLYLATGIRAAAHSAGMQKQTALNDLVRLAVPVGLKDVDLAIERIVAAFREKANLPELAVETAAPLGHGTFTAVRWHNAASAPAAEPAAIVEVATHQQRRTHDVAVVGMAGRYPKAKNLRELWDNLAAGRDCIEEIPADRYERRLQFGSTAKYRGGFLDGIDRFDSLFFNISPREAEMLDPQERLFLEVAWEAIEDAGYYPESLAREDGARNIGVYVGAVWAMYQMLGVEEKHAGNKLSPNSFLWSIANRVSYALNLSGPSLTVDTACSSSLTALYLAVEAIQNGECSAAIVGGVNLDLHQSKFDINLYGGALSPDGVCRTFGKGANGYVAGEGVGALFLKPLAQAERDGDNIYGVIRSAVVNHGGRTSGYTVPNPKAQAGLIQAALEKADVPAASIGYIEAHGTGTELGDPVEIAGLTTAFGAEGIAPRTFAIGSIKTNIGHLEAAAGVVSVSKVLLQMKHRRLVPSLHSAEPNEHIDFTNSPFHVVQKLEPWTTRDNAPLRAGISSFGAGGANAHVVLEEYRPAARAIEPQEGELLFPLSAKSDEQLREMAVRLADFLRASDDPLTDVAFTLQAGRKSFEHRAAIVARTREELIERLTALASNKKSDDVITGNVRGAEGVTRLLGRSEKQELVRLVSQSRDPRKLAGLWAEGLITDWSGIATGGKRVSLPTYPFADRRHWVAGPAQVRRVLQAASGVHPMVDSNESTFERQLFRKTFTEGDFFIYDHHVSDIPTLPGVAYLEFARKAGELAAGRPVRKIRNILWVSPIAVQSAPKEVFIELKPAGEAVRFEVFSNDANGSKVPHSQGTLHYATRAELEAAPEYVDLDAVRSRCTKVIDGARAYPLFKSFGLTLGPSFQVLTDVFKHDRETLGILQLPPFRHADLEAMPLHPSLVDGSLQAGMAAQLGDQAGEMFVPFSIGEVEIIHPLQPSCFSYVEALKEESSRLVKSNVSIVDETGRVLVKIRESVGVPLREVHKKEDGAEFPRLYYSYDWEEAALPAASTATVLSISSSDDIERIVASLDGDERICFTPANNAVHAFLALCQGIIARKLDGNVRVIYAYDNAAAEHEAIGGFIKALQLEHPKFFCKSVETSDLTNAAAEFEIQDAVAVRYDGPTRFIKKLRAFALEETRTSFRESGTYVITGGAGGLGLIFADFLARECKANLVLTGRSPLSPAIEAKLDALRSAGASDVLYVAADVAAEHGVRAMIDAVKSRFGAIHGVIHSAGVLRDSFVRNKTRDEMTAVLAPKVDGTRHLDALTAGEPLDFFVTFSSLAAIAGNAGQCDYAYANHFMDAFAAEREQLRAQGFRNGRSLSVNWSLWADGGMKLDEQTERYFEKTVGMKALSTAAGLDAFVRGLASARTQFAVLEGVQEKVETAWGLRRKAAPVASPAPSAGDADLTASLLNDLTKIVMEFLKLEAGDVSHDKILLDLGFDSIGLTTFANAINDTFSLDITPVLFFDYPSLGEISRHLANERRSEIARHYGNAAPAAKPAVVEENAITFNKGWAPPAIETTASINLDDRFAADPIAIVGMHGVMPQSDDLDEFWENLRASRNLVTVVPRDRWRWEDYYGDPLKETNKSNSKWGGFMREVDKFDPLFFGISPREAQMMDPQQRLFLETVWKAVEDSGQKVSDLSNTRTGLFVGVATNDYADVMNGRGLALDGYTASGNSHSVLANRVSFMLNLRGPSAPIDTACSSSLVALHRAIESIHTGSCDMAIVGGVQVMLSPAAYISFGMAGMLSGDGKCKTFDKNANGYVRGEGCGAIFLKKLSAAEADGNHIYAVIRATAENHGGRVTTLTAPNSSAQAELLVEAYEKARIDPATVGYIECHGTGTSLGDPIEIQALGKAFGDLYKKRGKTAAAPHCGLSSVKTNIGHLETAAGIAGVLKVLLAIRHRQIPANLHFEELNPYINLKGTPFFIAETLTEWNAARAEDDSPLPLRAGVSSFGFGGANAHIVLEEYLAPARPASRVEKPQLIVLSAKNEERLAAYVRAMQAFLAKNDVDLADFAYTLQIGRDEMPARLAFVASSIEEVKQKFAAGEGFRGNVRNPQGQSTHDVNDLLALAQLWVSGAKIDWRLLHGDDAARRISAPTYPFARERYWMPGAEVEVEPEPVAESRLQSFVPLWQPARVQTSAIASSTRVLLLGSDPSQLDWVRRDFPGAQFAAPERIDGDAQLLWIAPDAGDDELVEQQEAGVLELFRIAKSLLPQKKLQWTIITRNAQQVGSSDSLQPAHAGVIGFVGSLAKECPHWNLRLLDLEALTNVSARECLSLPFDKQGNVLAHRGGAWQKQELAPTTASAESVPLLRESGVYVVIGGAGGIGEVFTRFLIEQYHANVIWIGRRPIDASIEEKIKSLARIGPAPLYLSADATNRESLEAARQSILEIYPCIHGVVQSAIVLRDQSIARMDEADFRAGLAAKVDVSVTMDHVFGGDALDFMLFFSSIISFYRSPGQSNYSAGCTFKDAFAQKLRAARPYPVKIMNWGYWGSVGAAASATHNELMARMGIGSIEPAEGMAALASFIGSDVPQMLLVKTLGAAIATTTVSDAIAQTTAKKTAPAKSARVAAGVDRVRSTVLAQLSDALRMDAKAIRGDVPFAEYGVDSIIGVNLVRTMNEALGIDLQPMSLVEHATVDALTAYINANFTMPEPEIAIEPEESAPDRELTLGPIAIIGVCSDPSNDDLVEQSNVALDDAGYANHRAGAVRCGVYLGCGSSHFDSRVAARVAASLDLHGPALSIDTAHSSALVSVHLACAALWMREADLAIAGGAGDGVLLLKRLDEAQRDRDLIHGVIAGSGIDHDHANGSAALGRLQHAVQERFAIDSRTIEVTETATGVTDVVELLRGRKRRAAASSFGFGGTNASLILDQAPAAARTIDDAPAYLIALSASSPEQLQQQLRDLPAREVSLTDLSYTLLTGRRHFAHRIAFVVRDLHELRVALASGVAATVEAGRENATLRKFGNHCIRECRNGAASEDYIEALTSVADLWMQGYALDYASLFPPHARRTSLIAAPLFVEVPVAAPPGPMLPIKKASAEEILETVLWQDEWAADGYEKVTF